MSGKQKLDRLKMSDKPMLDPHREFLDMDTDEEDFGRQETTEAEEESLPEPERPAYETEELMILVQYVKKLLIVLLHCKESDCDESCYETIREYFCNPAHDILSIFYENDSLTAALEIPRNSTEGFAYFLRPHWHIFTHDNFCNTISCGTINENVNKSIIKFMENMCAPIILNYPSWPRIIQNKLFSNLNELLVRSMELIYKSEGVTTLYVPRERGLDFTVSDERRNCILTKAGGIPEEELETQKEFSARLENVVYHWIRQIRNAIRSVPRRNNNTNLLHEVHFWTAKSSNLSNLHSQFLSSDVQTIVKTLKYFRSPTEELLNKLIGTLRTGIEEARSNSRYLQMLNEYSRDINVLEDASGSITKCLLVILFIWSESPYYSTTGNIEILCGSLSTQIINQCVVHINLSSTLGSNPEEGIATVKKCIRCCIAYKSFYNKLTTEVASWVNPNKWNVREEFVFNNMRIFTQRCRDVINISKMSILYGRCNKAGLLGTPKNAEYEVYCRKMETIFIDSLNNIKVSQAKIFDVTDSSWLNKIKHFRNNILQLENMTKNLIIDVFSRVKNIEEGIEALYAFAKYRNVNFLQDLLQQKWAKVWQIFHGEIEFCYVTAKRFDKRRTKLSCSVSLSKYLQKQHDIMIKASYWLGNSVAEKCILQEYKRVIKSLNA